MASFRFHCQWAATFALLLSIGTPAKAQGYGQNQGETRTEAIGLLQSLKSQNTARLAELDGRVQMLLYGKGSVELNKTSGLPANGQLSLGPTLPNVEGEIDRLQTERQEHLLRQQFLDRVLFQIDSHYKGGSLRQFLQVRLVEMARADLLDGANQSRSWKYVNYLAQILRELPQSEGRVLSVIEGYLKVSNFSDPQRPEEFLKNQQYTNGRDHFAAKAIDRSQIGDEVEAKINASENQRN